MQLLFGMHIPQPLQSVEAACSVLSIVEAQSHGEKSSTTQAESVATAAWHGPWTWADGQTDVAASQATTNAGAVAARVHLIIIHNTHKTHPSGDKEVRG